MALQVKWHELLTNPIETCKCCNICVKSGRHEFSGKSFQLKRGWSLICTSHCKENVHYLRIATKIAPSIVCALEARRTNFQENLTNGSPDTVVQANLAASKIPSISDQR